MKIIINRCMNMYLLFENVIQLELLLQVLHVHSSHGNSIPQLQDTFTNTIKNTLFHGTRKNIMSVDRCSIKKYSRGNEPIKPPKHQCLETMVASAQTLANLIMLLEFTLKLVLHHYRKIKLHIK